MAVMDQDTRWMTRYNEVMTIIESNHRNPSKYADEERRMLHFMKRGKNDRCWGVEGTEIESIQRVVETGGRVPVSRIIGVSNHQ